MEGNKPIYKKWGFWAVLIMLGIIGNLIQDDEETNVEINNTEVISSIKPISSEKPKIIDGTVFSLEDNIIEDETIDLEIQGIVEKMEEYHQEYLVGVIRNNTNKEYGNIEVKFGLYDIDGNKLGSAYEQIEDLEANGTWKFKVELDGVESDAVNCKIKEIKIY